jgi:putative DNA primase/helicase
MTYQIQPPLTIAIKGKTTPPGADFSVNGHGFRPKRTAIPLVNVPWQNNGQLVHTSTQALTSAGQPGSAQKPSDKKEDKRSTELIYAEELVKNGQLAVRDDVIHRWNGSHYEAMNSKATVRHALKWLASKFPRQANKSMAHACVEAASLLLPQMPERDPQRTIIPLRNAYIEVKADASFERHLPHPSFGMTSALKITLPGGGKSYMPGALPPTSRLAKFLNSSVPDAEVCNFLQELMGDTLTPSNRHQVATLLKGSGRNGKSVLVRLMTALHEKVAHMRLDKLSGFQLMPLLDASLVVAEEVPAAGFDEQTLKSLISGESVTVDRKYLSPVSYRPSAKWIISTNNDQRSRDNTTGFWRRLCIIPFTQQIDPNDVITDLLIVS